MQSHTAGCECSFLSSPSHDPGASGFARCCRSLEPVSSQESLELQRGTPGLVQTLEILIRHFKERSLRDEHLRERRCHLSVSSQIQAVCFFSARKDLGPISFG